MNRWILMLSIYFIALLHNSFATNQSCSTNLQQSFIPSESNFKPVIKDWRIQPNPLAVNIFDKTLNIEHELSFPVGKTKLTDLQHRFYSRSQMYQPPGSDVPIDLWTFKQIEVMENGFQAREQKKNEKNPGYTPKTLQQYLRHFNTIYWQAKYGQEPPFSYEDDLRLPPYFSSKREPGLKKIPLTNEPGENALFPVLSEPAENQLISSNLDLTYSLGELTKGLSFSQDQRDLFKVPIDDYEAYLKECGRKEKNWTNYAFNSVSLTSWSQWKNAKFDPTDKVRTFIETSKPQLSKSSRFKNPVGQDKEVVELNPAEQELWREAQRVKSKTHRKVQIPGKANIDQLAAAARSYMTQWVKYFCADPTVANDTAVKKYNDYLKKLQDETTVDSQVDKEIIEKSTIPSLIRKFVEPYFRAEDVRRWIQLKDPMLKELILNRYDKCVFDVPCVLADAPLEDERRSQTSSSTTVTKRTTPKWGESFYLWNEQGKHFTYYIGVINRTETAPQPFSHTSYTERYLKYLALLEEYNPVLKDIKDAIEYWRSMDPRYWRNGGHLDMIFLEAVYYPLATPKPQQMVTKCILNSCQLESRWITRQKKRHTSTNGSEIRLVDIPSELSEVEEVDLSNNCLKSYVGNTHTVDNLLQLPFHPKHLRVLNLNFNQIENTYFLRDFLHLEELYLQGNRIQTFRVPNNWTVLRKLDLSSNQLSTLVFEQPANVAQSTGSMFSWSQPEPITQPHRAIQVLHLENNPFNEQMFMNNNSNSILLNPAAKVFISEEVKGVWEDLNKSLNTTGNFKNGCSNISEEEILVQDEKAVKGTKASDEELVPL